MSEAPEPETPQPTSSYSPYQTPSPYAPPSPHAPSPSQWASPYQPPSAYPAAYPAASPGVAPPGVAPPEAALPGAAPAPGATAVPGRRPLGLWLLLGSGLAAVLGSFLTWVTVTMPMFGTIQTAGTEGSDGWITAALGLVLVVLAAATMRGWATPSFVPIVELVVALALLGIAIWKIIEVRATRDDLLSQLAGTEEEDPFGLGQLFAQALQVRVGPGLWLILGAGLVGLAGAGLVGLAGAGPPWLTRLAHRRRPGGEPPDARSAVSGP